MYACFWKPEYLDGAPTRTQGDRVNITLGDRTRSFVTFGGGGANYGTQRICLSFLLPPT